MKSKYIFLPVAILAGVVFLVQCSSAKKADDPKAVATKFWQASETGKIENMKPYITQKSLASDMMKEDAKAEKVKFTLGEAAVEGEKATVPTTIEQEGFPVNMKTILVKEEGAWKVDVEQTMMTMMEGAMGDLMKGLENMGQDLGKQLGDAMNDAAKQLGQELAKVDGTVVDTVPKPEEPVKEDVVIPPPPVAGVDKTEVGKILAILSGTDDAAKEKVADYVGGLSSKLDVELTKPIVVAVGGIEREFNFKVSQPTVIITSGGLDNKFSVTKADGFTGEVLFVKQAGSNTYNGATVMSIDEYKFKNFD